MTKFLLFVCLISAALFGFASASLTAYAYKPTLAEGNQYRKFFNAYQKRDTGVGRKKIDGELVKRAISPTLQIAQVRSHQAGATTTTVLEGLLAFLANGNHPIAIRAAEVISAIAKKDRNSWRLSIHYIFQNNPINLDNGVFFHYLLGSPMDYREVVIGIVLSMVHHTNGLTMGHPDMAYILNNSDLNGGSSTQLRHKLMAMGNKFSYNGQFPPSLVIDVIVAAVAVSRGEVRSPQDIPRLIPSSQ